MKKNGTISLRRCMGQSLTTIIRDSAYIGGVVTGKRGHRGGLVYEDRYSASADRIL